MGSNHKTIEKPVYYLVTEKEVYRTDEMLQQIDEWIDAFLTGKWIRCPEAPPEALDEFEAHLLQTLQETQKLIRNDLEF
jgi:hypothetical protein